MNIYRVVRSGQKVPKNSKNSKVVILDEYNFSRKKVMFKTAPLVIYILYRYLVDKKSFIKNELHEVYVTMQDNRINVQVLWLCLSIFSYFESMIDSGRLELVEAQNG